MSPPRRRAKHDDEGKGKPDYYPTTSGALYALTRTMQPGPVTALDPCAGTGLLLHWWRRATGGQVLGLELRAPMQKYLDRDGIPGIAGVDSLLVPWEPLCPAGTWCVMNPPFVLLQEFVERGISFADKMGTMCCVLSRTGWLQTWVDRLPRKPDFVISLPWRPRFNGTGQDFSNYVWSVWVAGGAGRTDLIWAPKVLDMPAGDVQRHMDAVTQGAET